MIRSAPWLLGLLALAACHAEPPLASAGPEAACRWRPDGGPPLVERGIGGTGAPARQADRGIGGTGIVGIVAGFASVCVDGREIAYDPAVPVDIDGVAASADALRVGQVIAIAAIPDASRLRAVRVSARHEVTGPVTGVGGPDAGVVVVAGQRVRIPSTAVGSAVVRAGEWVAVSGMRGPDGDVIASRIDPAPFGPVSVHGPLIVSDGTAWIGELPVRRKDGFDDSAGTYVFVSGTLGDGVLRADALVPDTLIANPPAYFGGGTTQIAIASYARVDAGSVRIGGGFAAPAAPGTILPAIPRGLVVVSMAAQPDGRFAVVGIRAARGFAGSAGALGGAPANPAVGGGPALPRPAIANTPPNPMPLGAGSSGFGGTGAAAGPVQAPGPGAGGSAAGMGAVKAAAGVRPPGVRPPH